MPDITVELREEVLSFTLRVLNDSVNCISSLCTSVYFGNTRQHASDAVCRVDVQSLLQHEDVLPSVTLRNHTQPLRSALHLGILSIKHLEIFITCFDT